MNRRSVRIPGFDYANAGAYYITICTHERESLFGDVSNFDVVLNKIGNLVADSWSQLPEDYSFISLDDFTVMPNHFHGILWLSSDNPSRKPLSRIIAAFKAITTSRARLLYGNDFRLWQRGFYEHVIRSDKDLFRIREYIQSNSIVWDLEQSTTQIGAGACNAPLQSEV